MASYAANELTEVQLICEIIVWCVLYFTPLLCTCNLSSETNMQRELKV
jgi:hypothetical protein